MASLTISRRFFGRVTTFVGKRVCNATVYFAVACALFASSTLSYAQLSQFPLLSGGRALDGSARRVPKTVERRNSDGGVGYNDYQSTVQSQTNRVGKIDGGSAYPVSPDSRSAVATSGRSDSRSSVNNGQTQVAGASSGNSGQRTLSGTRADERAKLLARTRAISPCLNLSADGRFEFLRVVARDQVANIETPKDGVLIVVPRKNFLNLAKVEDGADDVKGNGSLEGDADVSERTSFTSVLPNEGKTSDVQHEEKQRSLDNLPDDYVVFLLTNLELDERNLLRDAKDGRWNYTDLLNASLIAEGLTTNASRVHYRSRFETLLAALKVQTNGLPDQLMKTQRVYDFLHSKALVSKYDLNCSSVAASLDSGVFNCVSATVLFNCLASRVGLEVAALETTGHAKSRVKFDDSFLDIETTCSSWDRLPDKMRPYAHSRLSRENAGRIEGQGIPASVDGLTTELAQVDSLVNDSLIEDKTSRTVDDSVDGGATLQTVSNSKRVPTGQAYFKPVDFNREESSAVLRDVAGKQETDSSKVDEAVKNVDFSRSENALSEDGSTTFGIDQEAPLGYSFTRTRRPMREITDVELIATIYYNVGVDHYQSGDYEGAIASYIKAIQLAPNNQTILGNLKATLNNWAIDIAMKEKRYDAAIRITELGLAIDPDFHEFKMNMPIFFNDWIAFLAKDNKWAEIKQVQEKYWQLYPNERR